MIEPLSQPPAPMGLVYPADVQEAARAAAFLEIQWRLQDFVNRPMVRDHDLPMQWQAKAVLRRYLDILSDFWWAVYFDAITGSIVVSILTDEAYRLHPDGRHSRVSDVTN